MRKNILLLVFGIMIVSVAGAQTLTTEDMFKAYFTRHIDSLDEIEGIWNVSTTQEFYRYDTLYDVIRLPKAARVAVMKKGERYESFNLTGESYDVEFTRTEVSGVFFYRNYFKETNEHSKTDAVISKKGEMAYKYTFPDKYLRHKLGNTYEEGTYVTNDLKWVKIFPDQGSRKKNK